VGKGDAFCLSGGGGGGGGGVVEKERKGGTGTMIGVTS